MNMRYFHAPDHTRIVFDLTAPPEYDTSRENGNLVITFRETACFDAVSRETRIGKAGIGTVTISTPAEGDAVIRVELASHVEVNVFPLKQFLDKPDRLVIDVELPEIQRRESLAREQVKIAKDKKIVVIDPGHGGEDPGAVGRRGTLEKDVVLAISRRLKKALDRHGMIQAYLTRDGDYYVSFNKRLQIAREYGADFFISIHADAARNRQARGSSVYVLSTGGASSEAAKLLAQNENLSDIIGGVQELDVMEGTNPILINMFQTNTINVSKAFGMSVLWELSHVGELKFDRVQEAPFRVLKMPDIPAVLIETAYISNLDEEMLLRCNTFQQKVANRISRAIVQFLLQDEPDPARGVLVKGGTPTVDEAAGKASPKTPPRTLTFYTVQRGDTLTKIAQSYGITVRDIVEANALKAEAPLHVGRRLKIEGAIPAPPEKRYFTYTVQKGDSLTRIASRFNVPLENLLEDNQLKRNAPLHVGRRLRIEGAIPVPVVEAKSGRIPERQTGQDRGTYKTYRVKRGDTLLGIARKEGIPLEMLLKLNGMKLDDPLHRDRLLILGYRTES